MTSPTKQQRAITLISSSVLGRLRDLETLDPIHRSGARDCTREAHMLVGRIGKTVEGLSDADRVAVVAEVERRLDAKAEEGGDDG